MKKRNVAGILFGLVLILALTLGPSLKVSAAEQVPYVNITVDNNDILSISDKSISDYTVVSDQTTWGEAGTNKWYVVNSNVTIGSRITVVGDVSLILCDGSELKAPKGITVSGEGNSFTIYGQTNGSGKLTIVNEGDGLSKCAGIGGTDNSCGGNITINGGTVTSSGGWNGAGIGGGRNGDGINITINGGTVYATGRDFGAGIGGGCNGIGKNIAINGGTVYATGGPGKNGIGSGDQGADSSNININSFLVDLGSDIFIQRKITENELAGKQNVKIINCYRYSNKEVQFYENKENDRVVLGTLWNNSEASSELLGLYSDEACTIDVSDSGINVNEVDGVLYASSNTSVNLGTYYVGVSIKYCENEIKRSVCRIDVLPYTFGCPVYDTDAQVVIDTDTGTPKYEEVVLSSVVSLADVQIVGDSAEWGVSGKTTWYVVNSDVTIGSRITVVGDVSLILCDGFELKAPKGITVSGEGNSFTIYGESNL